MHQFLSVYCFTLLPLHVSATVCHPQGARLYLKLHANLGFWLVKFCVVCGWVYIVCRAGTVARRGLISALMCWRIRAKLFFPSGPVLSWALPLPFAMCWRDVWWCWVCCGGHSGSMTLKVVWVREVHGSASLDVPSYQAERRVTARS
jgi:hypothetical protein